jgi:hypothetical protein
MKFWKCPPRSAMHVFTPSSCLMQPGFCMTGNGSPDRILSFCLAQENREMYP